MNEAQYSINDPRYEGTMSSGWIKELAESDSRIHKEKVIEKALMASKLGSADAQAFLFNCYQAYNPFHTFHVKQLPETAGLTGRSNPWPRFWGLLEALRTRSTSGHAARDMIKSISEEFDSDEWNLVCVPVIRKDLRCGISEKTLNKVLGQTISHPCVLVPVGTGLNRSSGQDERHQTPGSQTGWCACAGSGHLHQCDIV